MRRELVRAMYVHHARALVIDRQTGSKWLHLTQALSKILVLRTL